MSFFVQVDLVGGYYDAGDNVKFGLPMAFTVTMLSWGVIEYGQEIADAGEYQHALEAIKWGTDYFIKAHTHPNVLWAEVIQFQAIYFVKRKEKKFIQKKKKEESVFTRFLRVQTIRKMGFEGRAVPALTMDLIADALAVAVAAAHVHLSFNVQ